MAQNPTKIAKEIAIYQCSLASETTKYRRRVDPTGMKSEPGISGSICWGKGTQGVGISIDSPRLITVVEYLVPLSGGYSRRLK